MTHPQCGTPVLYHLLKKAWHSPEPWLGEFQHPGAVVSSSRGGAWPRFQHCGTPVELQLTGFGLLKCCRVFVSSSLPQAVVS